MTSPDHNDLDGSVEGLPAFRCRLTPTGAWAFRCTCGKDHAHGPQAGHKAGHCDSHRPFGYVLLAPASTEKA